MWFIEYRQKEHSDKLGGAVYHSAGWWHAPLVIYEKWDGGEELPQVASYVNGFTTAAEARRVARRVPEGIEYRIVSK